MFDRWRVGAPKTTSALSLAPVCLLVALASAAPAWGGPAISFPTSFPPRTGCGPSNVEGWEFQTTEEITVSALGVYDSLDLDVDDNFAIGVNGIFADGLQHAIPVGLYDSSCQLVASATIPAGMSAPLLGGYRYVGITPVVLAKDSTFRVAAVMRCEDRDPEFDSPDEFSLDPALTGGLARRVPSGESLECPTVGASSYRFSPNFLIGPACQNGLLQGDEECDDGNGVNGDCCSATCELEAEGSPCPDDGDECSDDVCDATGICTHEPSPSSMQCRPADGDCDVAENCDGVSTTCPPDGFASSGECRASAGMCDAAESCDGSGPMCPANESEPDGTACTDDLLFCTGEETCQSGSCTSRGNPCDGPCDELADRCLTPSPTPTSTPDNMVTMTRTRTPTSTGTRISTVTGTQTVIASVTPTPTTSTTVSSPTATLPAPHTATPTGVASSTPTGTPMIVACVGDCDGSGTVVISELITGVNIVLGTQPIDRCPSFDASGNRSVEINELVLAVNNVLNDCL